MVPLKLKRSSWRTVPSEAVWAHAVLPAGLLVVRIDGIPEVYQADVLITAPNHNGTLGSDPFSQSKGIPSDVAVRHMQRRL